MRTYQENALPFISGIATSICVVVLTASISDDAVTSIERWVRDYQTLIGALFAVFAAYLTIAQMRWSDERQEERHRELLDFDLRREDRAIARFSGTVTPIVERSAKLVAEFVALYAETDEPDWNEDTYKKFHFALVSILMARTTLNGPVVQECSSLMPPALSLSIIKCSAFLDRAIAKTSKDRDIATMEMVEDEELQQWFEDGAGKSIAFLSERLAELSKLCREWGKKN